MSLLLDALKRAEQEKLARQATGAPPVGAHAAPAAHAARPSANDTASFSLEAMDAPRSMSAALGGPVAPVGERATGERSSAQQVFAAKRADPRAESSRRGIMIGAAAIVVVMIAGGAGYVWYQMQAFTPQSAPRSAAALRPVTPAPPPPASTALPPPSVAPPVTPPVAMLKPESVPEPKRSRPAPQAAEQLVMDLLRAAPPAGASPPLKLARSLDPPRVGPDVAAGYEALRRSDYSSARQHYQAALATEPSSVDALLGLATAESRMGQREMAQRHYRKALELDSRNPVALAGLAALTDFSRPGALEGQLRADIARFPRSAPLYFTLGNVYAAQSRWTDAQGAFFEAHRLEPANADYVHNLAVSLDQLGQPKVAAEYYVKALALARNQAVHFDARAVERRLAELKS